MTHPILSKGCLFIPEHVVHSIISKTSSVSEHMAHPVRTKTFPVSKHVIHSVCAKRLSIPEKMAHPVRSKSSSVSEHMTHSIPTHGTFLEIVVQNIPFFLHIITSKLRNPKRLDNSYTTFLSIC